MRGALLGIWFLLLALPAAAERAGEAPTSAALLAAVNELREQYGLARLLPDEELTRLSQEHALAMAAADCLDHDCAGSGWVGARAQQRGYAYLIIGEALAGGPPSVEAVVALWSQSQRHRDILLHAEITFAGAGHVFLPDDAGKAPFGHYWVLTVSRQP